MSSENLKMEPKESNLSNIPEDIGCENSICAQHDECQRAVIFHNGTAREVKKFGGTPEKGCGKFIPKKEVDANEISKK